MARDRARAGARRRRHARPRRVSQPDAAGARRLASLRRRTGASDACIGAARARAVRRRAAGARRAVAIDCAAHARPVPRHAGWPSLPAIAFRRGAPAGCGTRVAAGGIASGRAGAGRSRVRSAGVRNSGASAAWTAEATAAPALEGGRRGSSRATCLVSKPRTFPETASSTRRAWAGRCTRCTVASGAWRDSSGGRPRPDRTWPAAQSA